MQIIVGIIIFFFGASIGSFLNVLTQRLPQGRRASGRSACVHCHRTLAALDLVPLVSYVALGGRCRYCHKPISLRYPLVEAVTGLLFLFSYLAASPQTTIEYVALTRILFCVATFVVIFIIDYEHYLILDRVVVPASILVLLWNAGLDVAQHTFGWQSQTVFGLLAGLLACGFIWALWRLSAGKWIGLGDGKLLLFLGIALGWLGLLVAFFVALALGTAAAIVLLATHRKTMKSAVPFGTFLVIGGYVAILFGNQIWHWYASYIGLG